MTNKDEDKNNAGLVRSQSAALSQVGTASLASRGMKDLLAREEDAEQWYIKGLNLRAQEAYDAKRYKEAFACFQRGIALNPNHVGLQFCLGRAYCTGEGVSQNHGQAAFWWHKAADQGDASAQYSLGWLHENGRGVERDNAEAAAWYRLAAEQGDKWAQRALDDMQRK